MTPSIAKLLFAGGAGSVTGSNFLLETGNEKLLTDCGLLQGCEFCEDANYEPFPYEPSSVSTLFVTHAHLDHIGRIPKLVRDGFSGRIISTAATRDLARPILEDALGIMRERAERRGKKALFDEGDIAKAFELWEPMAYGETKELPEGVTARLYNAGHILGSAMVEYERGGRSILFTGDLGNETNPLLPPAEPPARADYLVMESVYGDRTHDASVGRMDELARVVNETVAGGGTLLIPAFATERTQDILFELGILRREKRIPEVPVYVDSPLAIETTHIYESHVDLLTEEARDGLSGGRLFAFPGLSYTRTPEESARIERTPGPKIILAGSGMSSGGRVLAHEARLLPDPKNAVLIVGYQAAGSLGRRIEEGAKEVEIDRKRVRVRAKVYSLHTYSAHLDMPGLVSFAERFSTSANKVFLTMGEPKAALFLAQRLHDFLGLQASVPERGEVVELEL